jgi:hypothetical protein
MEPKWKVLEKPPEAMPPKELRQHLNGLRARTSWTILTLHATSVMVRKGTEIVADGPVLFEYIRDPRYWANIHGRQVPTFLWDWMNMARKEGIKATSEVVGWAEATAYVMMVAEAYELALKCLERNKTRTERFHAQPFVQFAKVIRNTAFHGGVILECDGVKFPVEWSGLVLDDAKKGHSLQLIGWFNTEKAFELVEEFAKYGDHNFGSPERVEPVEKVVVAPERPTQPAAHRMP